MHRRRRTAVTLSAAALLAATPLLTACGNDARPGAAAVVGEQRITVEQLEGRVNAVRAAQRTAIEDDAQYAQVLAGSGELTRSTLHTMVLDRVLARAAHDAGVGVTRKDVQQLRKGLALQAGGEKGLQAAWLQQYNVPPSQLDASLRTEVSAQKLSEALGADMNTPAGQRTFWKALGNASEALGVRLNPRYGTWSVAENGRVGRVDAPTPWVRAVSEPDPGATVL
ncbi:SurA N-terminal domain-containing protein [Streptomyces sp. NPDC002454]|uniref:SurA N-terminal domain-containing protein n=1 Tax=Streptomyces sp. NPDC002490 TaxID=3154416 RepID=UPI00333408F5